MLLFWKNVWKSQHAENVRTTLKLFFHFALALGNNFLIDSLQFFFFHCYMLVYRVHPTGYSEANNSIPHIDKMLDQ